jgi:predicted nucleic acid-binding protein
MIVVADATPLIYLAAIGKFDLLPDLYGRITVPSAVYEEVVIQGAGRWGAAEMASAGWIDRETVRDPTKVVSLQLRLDSGENEVVVLAEELRADLVLMDEMAGRHELDQRGVTFMGAVGVLMQAKQRGFIGPLKPELDRLRVCGFHLGDQLYRACLAAVGE